MESKYDNIYTEKYLNDLLEATYEIAPAVYYRYTWHNRWGMTLDDYKQEAAMEIYRLFKERFITPPKENYTQTNLKTYVYSILNKYFTINLINTFNRDRVMNSTLHLESTNKGDYTTEEILDLLNNNSDAEQRVTPDDLVKILEGKDLVDSILENNFDVEPIRTNKHTYVDKKNISISELNIAKYILQGYTQTNLVEEYIDNNYEGGRQTFLRARYKRTFDKLSKLLSEFDEYKKNLIQMYLKSI